jgi:hypothetical protein
MSTIINFHAGPGTGKSTSSAYLYSLFKSIPLNAELVREYVKIWTYDGRQISPYDQIYFMCKQIRYESMLFNKVDYIITDSPVLISLYYSIFCSPPAIAEGVEQMVKSYYKQSELDGHKHVHIFLNRTKPYLQIGRFQGEEAAKLIDKQMHEMLVLYNIPFIECGTSQQELDKLFNSIINKEI